MRRFLKTTLLLLSMLASGLEAFAQDPAIILRYANRQVFNNGMSWKFDLEAKGNATYGGVENGSWIAMNVRADLGLPAGVTIVSGTAVGAPGHTISSGVQLNVEGDPPAGYREFGITLERGDNGTELSNDAFAVIGTFTLNFSAAVNQGDNAIPRLVPNNAGSSWVNLAQELLQRPFIFEDLSFPLPVRLVSFDAMKEKSIAQLRWTTAEEVNSDRFDVQRSRDGKLWKTIGSVKASGNYKGEKNYDFQDSSPLSGSNLYRLEMIDKDGSSAFSRIHTVKFEEQNQISVYPNPVQDKFLIKTTDVKSIKSVSVYNSAGIEVLHYSGNLENGVDVKSLATGLYTVKVTDRNDEVSSQNIVVAK